MSENKHNPSPYDSEEMLFGAINGSPDGLSLEDLEEIMDKEHLSFYLNPLRTLVGGVIEKRIIFDNKTGKFKSGLFVADGDRSQNQP
jgi:hypothetical protein